jgi:hypothetical protein
MKQMNKTYQFGNRINKQFHPEWGELDLYYIEGKEQKKSNQKIKYMMNEELMKMEFKNPKMFKKTISTLNKVVVKLKNEKQGNGVTFKTMMENFDCFRWMLHNSTNDEFKKDILTLMYAVYRRDGNKFQLGFNEFFEYISKHSFTEISEGELLVFRVMSSEEFENMKLIGNQNPCWSNSINSIEGFGILKVLTKETKRSLLVMAIYRTTDVIYFNENETYNNEEECWIKKGATPKYYGKLFGFEKTYLRRRTGLRLEEIDFEGRDSNNGFGWDDMLKTKYGIELGECESTLISFTKVVKKRMEYFVDKNNIGNLKVIRL